MKIEMLDINDVKEYEGNPREISEAAVEAVARSIKEFGFKNPVIVDKENVLVAGHTRVRAAKKLDMSQVPAVRADDLTPEQVKAFRLADNKLHELSQWNVELLPIELGELHDAGYDLELIGFPEDELAEIMDTGELKEGLTDPDAVPEPAIRVGLTTWIGCWTARPFSSSIPIHPMASTLNPVPAMPSCWDGLLSCPLSAAIRG